MCPRTPASTGPVNILNFLRHVPASVIHGFIRVTFFGVNTLVIFDVFESKIHETSIATVVSVTG